MDDSRTVTQQLGELQLIKCSLLPNEILHFVDDDDNDSIWAQLLNDHEMFVDSNEAMPAQAKFLIRLDSQVWLEVKMPDLRGESGRNALVSVKGDRLSGTEQETWRVPLPTRTRSTYGH